VLLEPEGGFVQGIAVILFRLSPRREVSGSRSAAAYGCTVFSKPALGASRIGGTYSLWRPGIHRSAIAETAGDIKETRQRLRESGLDEMGTNRNAREVGAQDGRDRSSGLRAFRSPYSARFRYGREL